MSIENTKPHECPKSECMCSETEKMENLYRELKLSHKNAVDKLDNEQKCGIEFHLSEKDCDESLGNDMLTVVKSQRESVKKLMEALGELNERLNEQEQAALLSEKEIADLQNEIRAMRKKFSRNAEESKLKMMNQRNRETGVEDDCWRMAVEMENREQRKLQEKMNGLCECLKEQKLEENSRHEEIQQERKKDTVLMLNAVNYMEECIHDCKTRITK